MHIAVLSDIHANLPALDAVLADLGSVDGIWHLGDVVGYGPEPEAVVARLREIGAVGVRGNHDAAACGGREIEWFNPDARRAMEWTRAAIGPATIAWLEALPERRTLEGVELVHGSPREPIWEYVTSSEIASANLSILAARIGLHGHTHVPVAWIEGDAAVGTVGTVELVRPHHGANVELAGRKALINPGSVGQPRDGDPDASYAILDPEAGVITWHRVPYDIDGVQRAMRDAGLPASLSARLSAGF